MTSLTDDPIICLRTQLIYSLKEVMGMTEVKLHYSELKWLPKITRAFQKELDQQLVPLKLNASLYYYILNLHDQPKMSQEQLVQALGVNPSNVTRAVKQLVELGYVKKVTNEQDHRGFLLQLTAKGIEIYEVVVKVLGQVEGTFLAHLTAEERASLLQLLGKLAKEMER